MDNYAIADQLSLLSKLMDIHGDNSFKAKSYASAAFAIEKLPQEIASLSADKIFKIRGIGESVGSKVVEILQSGELQSLKEYIRNTPEGVLEMLNIKGLGPKKINALWKEMNIETIEDLKDACLHNKVADKKGFGEKTQQKILEEINFQQYNSGKYLYAQIENFAEAFDRKLKDAFGEYLLELTGEFRRQLEVIEQLEWVTTVPKETLKQHLLSSGLSLISEADDKIVFDAESTLHLVFHLTGAENFYQTLFETSCSKEFFVGWNSLSHEKSSQNYTNEEAIFDEAGLPFIPAFLREEKGILKRARAEKKISVIEPNEIKGLIHSHSNWSDGGYTIEQMANELIKLGFEYLVISDHSKAAYYASGLSEERIRQQHLYIDELNKKMAPFKIFKSIECDILGDGSMDYSNDVLATFDLVIASIHSNLQMAKEKAMQRLLGAITNPYTTILGHMTGRLLTKRRGYPVDHKTIIDACAEHKVVIEINANPKRLDMDWRWIEYALEQNVLLSIDPDAHTLDEFSFIRYGVLVAQKGGLTKKQNLSSLRVHEFELFLQQRKKEKGII